MDARGESGDYPVDYGIAGAIVAHEGHERLTRDAKGAVAVKQAPVAVEESAEEKEKRKVEAAGKGAELLKRHIEIVRGMLEDLGDSGLIEGIIQKLVQQYSAPEANKTFGFMGFARNALMAAGLANADWEVEKDKEKWGKWLSKQ